LKTDRIKPPGLPAPRLAHLGIVGLGGAAIMIGSLALWMPQTAIAASLRGVAVWWEVLFPALFPFFVLSELLLGFGIVHFAGTLLDPLMRPLFRLPGVGGFVVAMGFASGYPVGARLTSRLMEQEMVSREQGERLVAITTTSDPIFLIGAVCIGFFGSLQAAPAIAAAHYGGALALGLLARFRAPLPEAPAEAAVPKTRGRFRTALAAMHRARLQDGRPFAVMLQQSLQSSLGLMMIVGGLVVFFSAMLELFVQGGVLTLYRDMTAGLMHLFGLSPHLSQAVVHGTFEVTLGAKAAAGSGDALPLVDRAAAAAFVLSWAGLSVHAQVAGLMSRTAWRYWPFARDRLIHSAISVLLVYALWPWLGGFERAGLPAWLQDGVYAAPLSAALWLPLAAFALLMLVLLAGSLVVSHFRHKN